MTTGVTQSQQLKLSARISRLNEAARSGDHKKIKKLLKKFPDRRCRENNCLNAAIIAAEFGQTEAFRLLFKCITNEDIREHCRKRSAKSAVETDNEEVLMFIFEKMTVNSRDQLCLYLAKYTKSRQIVKLIVQTTSDAGIQDKCCKRMMEQAVTKCSLDTVKLLVFAFHDKKIKSMACGKGVVKAAEKGDLEAVKLLLVAISDVNVKDECLRTASEVAATKAHLKIVHFLLGNTFYRQLRNDCCVQVVRHGCYSGQWDFIIRFFESGKSFVDEKMKNECLQRASELAIKEGAIEVPKRLIDGIADQNSGDQCCLSLIKLSARKGSLNMIEFILNRISDSALKEQGKKDAVECAASMGNLELTRYCIESISDHNTQMSLCQFALKFASSAGHTELCIFLLTMLDDTIMKDTYCCFAAEISAGNGHLETLQSLISIFSDKRMRDKCLVDSTEKAVAGNQLKVLEFLIDHSNDTHDKCCIKGAESAATIGNVDVFEYIIQRIPQRELRYKLCEKAIEVSAYGGNSTSVKGFSRQILDQNLKDQCNIVGANSAATNGHLEIVQFLMQEILDPTRKIEGLKGVLRSAAQSGKNNIVKYVMETIEYTNLKDDLVQPATILAAKTGHLKVVETLINCIIDQTIRDRCCEKSLDFAAGSKHFEVVYFLLQTVTDQTLLTRCSEKSVEAAASAEELKWVELYLNRIADTDARDKCCTLVAKRATNLDFWVFLSDTITNRNIRDECFKEGAVRTARTGSLDVVTFIVRKIADLKLKHQCCSLATISAAQTGHLNVVEFLVNEMKAKSVEMSGTYLKATGEAIRGRHFKVAEKLMFNSLNITPKEMFRNHPEFLIHLSNLVITNPSRVSAITEWLKSETHNIFAKLLRASIVGGHIALAKIILDNFPKNASIDVPNRAHQSTALMLAADENHNDIIQLLLNRGASVVLEDDQGRTALSRACLAGHVRAVKTLLEFGAEMNHCDRDGLSCLKLAKKHRDVLRLLRDKIPRNESYLSRKLHDKLNIAGFTKERAESLQHMAYSLQQIARCQLTDDSDIQMTGSFPEGWVNNLEQVNGRTGRESDIDWTIMDANIKYHLEGCFDGKSNVACNEAEKVVVLEGHAQVQVSCGNQPASRAKAAGIRAAFDTCHAYLCCGLLIDDKLKTIIKYSDSYQQLRKIPNHLVSAIRPNQGDELRVSFSFHEKLIMSKLTTVQGQLFYLLKFTFRSYLPKQDITGLKTYHAKTLLFFMLERYGGAGEFAAQKESVWRPQNLIKLFKESLDMMLEFINSNSSPDVCMPHFFMPDAPLYFKNAGIGGDFQHTKTRVRDGLTEIKGDIDMVVERIIQHLRPLESQRFYFHPFTLLPLTSPRIYDNLEDIKAKDYATVYSYVFSSVYQCLNILQMEPDDVDESSLMAMLSHLEGLSCCKCAALCMTAMTHLKFHRNKEAEKVMKDASLHSVQSSWHLEEVVPMKPNVEQYKTQEDYTIMYYPTCPIFDKFDWAWRYCLSCNQKPNFLFLPEITQELLTARLEQKRSAHMYVNFRCLSWSLQAELFQVHEVPEVLTTWLKEVQEDPDLEELLTLSHYSNSPDQLQTCLKLMETIRDEGRVAMDKQDMEKIKFVQEKLLRCESATDDEEDNDTVANRRFSSQSRVAQDSELFARFAADSDTEINTEAVTEAEEEYQYIYG